MYKLFIRNQLQLSMGIYWWEDVLLLKFRSSKILAARTEPINGRDGKSTQGFTMGVLAIASKLARDYPFYLDKRSSLPVA